MVGHWVLDHQRTFHNRLNNRALSDICHICGNVNGKGKEETNYLKGRKIARENRYKTFEQLNIHFQSDVKGFIDANKSHSRDGLVLFTRNAKYIIYAKGWTINGFFNILKQFINISRTGFLMDERPGTRVNAPNFLYIATFSRLLNVPFWMLFSEDIERDYADFIHKSK